MAMKAIKSITRTATINGEELTFKATMKQYNKRDKEWKEARKNYEDMIIQQIARITKLDKVNDDF